VRLAKLLRTRHRRPAPAPMNIHRDCPTLGTAPTAHHPMIAPKKPARDSGQFIPIWRPSRCGRAGRERRCPGRPEPLNDTTGWPGPRRPPAARSSSRPGIPGDLWTVPSRATASVPEHGATDPSAQSRPARSARRGARRTKACSCRVEGHVRIEQHGTAKTYDQPSPCGGAAVRPHPDGQVREQR